MSHQIRSIRPVLFDWRPAGCHGVRSDGYEVFVVQDGTVISRHDTTAEAIRECNRLNAQCDLYTLTEPVPVAAHAAIDTAVLGFPHPDDATDDDEPWSPDDVVTVVPHPDDVVTVVPPRYTVRCEAQQLSSPDLAPVFCVHDHEQGRPVFFASNLDLCRRECARLNGEPAPDSLADRLATEAEQIERGGPLGPLTQAWMASELRDLAAVARSTGAGTVAELVERREGGEG